MPNTGRELAELLQVIIDATTSLSTHARTLVDRLVDELTPDEPTPDPLTASASGVTGNDMTVELVWNNAGTGNHVRIDWGVPDVVDDDEPATGTKTYQYDAAGGYEITVTDHVDPTRVASVDVTVPIVTGA